MRVILVLASAAAVLAYPRSDLHVTPPDHDYDFTPAQSVDDEDSSQPVEDPRTYATEPYTTPAVPYAYYKILPEDNTGCKEWIVFNNGRRTLRMACVEGKFYNADIRRCDDKWNVKACDESTEPRALRTTTVPTFPAEATTTEVSDVSRECAPHTGCHTWFTSCRSYEGVFVRVAVRCPAGLYYDATAHRCDYRQNVAACADPAPTRAYDCAGRADGVYTEGCSHSFWYCSGGAMTIGECPHRLHFNPDTQRCDYKLAVAACVAERAVDEDDEDAIDKEEEEEDTTLPPADDATPIPSWTKRAEHNYDEAVTRAYTPGDHFRNEHMSTTIAPRTFNPWNDV